MLVLQALNGLSLEQTEFLVKDRLIWMRFCGLGPGDAVPDANTLWDFREALIAADALDALFARLDRAISEAGYLPMSGQIMDATLVAAPRQRNTEDEKARIKAGETVREIWEDKPFKARQKDTDAPQQRAQCVSLRLPDYPVAGSWPDRSTPLRVGDHRKIACGQGNEGFRAVRRFGIEEQAVSRL